MAGDAEYDFFISHATEDKDDVARPLAEHLDRAGYGVWYDEFSLRLGDSLRESIDKGLRASQHGILVLSPYFFAKPWPRAELDGLTTLFTSGKVKKLLPVWHEVGRSEVEEFSPSLAGKVGVPTSYGLDRVISDVVRAVEDDEDEVSRRIGAGHLPVVRAVFVIRAQSADGEPRILVGFDRVWDCCLLPNVHAEGRSLLDEDDPYLCDRLAAYLGLPPGTVHARHIRGAKLCSHKYSPSRDRETTYHFHFFAATCEPPDGWRARTFASGGTDYLWLRLAELQSSKNADRNQDVFDHLRDNAAMLVEAVPSSCTLASA
jgi:hypothetical protein